MGCLGDPAESQSKRKEEKLRLPLVWEGMCDMNPPSPPSHGTPVNTLGAITKQEVQFPHQLEEQKSLKQPL